MQKSTWSRVVAAARERSGAGTCIILASTVEEMSSTTRPESTARASWRPPLTSRHSV